MARRKAGTDRLARLSPTESLQNQKLLQSICTGTADIFFCRPRREGWGLQTLARFRISGGGGGHFSGEFLDETQRNDNKCNFISNSFLAAGGVAFRSDHSSTPQISKTLSKMKPDP